MSQRRQSILLTSMRSPYLDSDRVYPPLGLLYLKSALDSAGYTVYLEDEFNFTAPEKYRHIDVFGASVMTPQREASLEFLTFCKLHFPDKPVVIGGPHAKHYLEEVQKEAWDYIVPSDGIRPVVNIMQGSSERVLHDFMSKQEWQNIERPDRKSIEACAMLSKYIYTFDGRRATTMLTALGCPELCTFCEDARTAVRWSSLENIKLEIDDIVSLGYNGVYLFDDLFAISLKMIRPICDELKKRDLVYRCNGQARYFNEEFAKTLAETGCKEIAFGAETGSQKILDNIQKRTTVEMNYRFVELCKKYGIVCKAFILLGLPGEDWDTLKDTERFIATSGCDDYQIVCYSAYKGTTIRDAIDIGDSKFDIEMLVQETSGAYGIRGGETIYETRTKALSAEDLKTFRDHLVKTYRPQAHRNNWDDKFFDTHLAVGGY